MPTRRAARPRSPTAPRRSSSPPPATTCASRCTRWACSPRRCASAAHDPEVAHAGEQHQRLGRRAGRPVRRAARHHAHRHRRRRGATPRRFRCASCSRSCACTSSPTAFEKGLALRFRGGSHVAFADPVLVERILRNLVSNAIRYTDDGGVLVGCRAARRASCCCRCGTPASASPRASSRASSRSSTRCRASAPLEPHQRKGLGLGLAIVKRLAELLEAPIALRSRVGRGTVFTFEVPPGKAVRALEPAVTRGEGAAGPDAGGPADVVVEDEPAVREGLEVLLKGWGASVLDFDSVAVAARPGWPARPIAGARPADRRLPAAAGPDRAGRAGRRCARTGRAASCRPSSSPAAPSAATRAEASEHDFHLLIKPVLPNKLRAMIAFKLGVR